MTFGSAIRTVAHECALQTHFSHAFVIWCRISEQASDVNVHAAAQEQPPEASVDEPNPAKVEPLC